jgi:hypothetical protein
MRHMLRALGFWIWGLIAISIAVSVVPLGYRVAALWRLHDISAPSDPGAPSGTASTQSPTTGLQPANLRAAQDAYVTALATGAYTPEETQRTNQMVFRLAAGNQDYPTAVAYGEQLAAAGSATPGDLTVLAQVTYLQKDCKNSGLWADKAIAAARKAGEAPKENLFQFKLQCASDAGDNAAMAAVLIDLIKLTNKTNYWNTLLRIERQEERDDHNLLMVYRVMYDTGSMSASSDYMEWRSS